MKTKMMISAKFGNDYGNGIKNDSITLKSADINSLLKGVVPSHIVEMLQEIAKQKVQYDLQKSEDANKTQKSNQVLIDSGLKMYALFSERGDKDRKNPKSNIFLAKDIKDASQEYGYLTGWGTICGEIDEWKGTVPKYVLLVAGSIKHRPR
jgi:hypothetical protein